MNARITILTIIAAALIVAPAAAQSGPGTCDGSGPHGPGGPGPAGFFGGPGGPGGHHLIRLLDRVGDRIGLTDTQRTEIESIIDATTPELDALRDQAMAARDAFHDEYSIGDWDETAFRAFFEAQAQLHVEMKLIGAEAASRVWAVLTPEQQSEVLDLIALFRDGSGGPRHGGKRHGGGWR